MSPRILLVAGVPRSGSTWAFNAVRLLLRTAGAQFHAAWVKDYQPEDPAPIHLVKVHRQEEVTFDPELVITTHRPTEARIASLVRMGWLENDPAKIRRVFANHQLLYAHWRGQSDIEIEYEDILNAPAPAVERLAGACRLELTPAQCAAVAKELAGMAPPETGHYDKETLLHPRHRGSAEDSAPSPAEILKIVGS